MSVLWVAMPRHLVAAAVVLWCLLACLPEPDVYAAAPHDLVTTTFMAGDLTTWKADTPGWQISAGRLMFDGHTTSEILAPVTTRGVQDYAVEAQVQSLGAGDAQASGYGLVVHHSDKLTSGIRAGMGLSIPESATEPQLLWSNDGAGGSLVQLQPGFNTFRIDVHGADYDLSIDGVDAVHLRIDTTGKGTRIGIWSGGYALQISSFRLLNLSHENAPARLPPLKTLDVRPSDLPKTLHRLFGHYWTNDEYARANLIPLADLTTSGRLMTYETGYLSPARTGFYAASGFLAAFKSASEAASAFSPSTILAPFTGLPKYTEAAVPTLGLDAFRMHFEFQDNNGPIADVDGVFFHTGRYLAILYGDFSLEVPATTQAADLLSAARAVQSRVRVQSR